jgi:hypothetical protein
MPRLSLVLALATLVSFLSQPALADPIGIAENRVYRAGVFLVVDALVTNQTAHRIDGIEVTIEFLDFFGQVKRVEHTWASPRTLGPGLMGALRAVTPYSDEVRKLLFRFTWWQNGAQFQAVVRRDVWTIGSREIPPWSS